MRGNPRVARWLAPAAFLAAATIAILIVRSGLSNDEEASSPPPAATTTTAPATTTRPQTTRPTTTAPAPAAEFYVIEAGDTLAVIADRYETTVEELLVLNPDIDPVSLTIGQRIRVK
jgi:LysM repeat protein